MKKLTVYSVVLALVLFAAAAPVEAAVLYTNDFGTSAQQGEWTVHEWLESGGDNTGDPWLNLIDSTTIYDNDGDSLSARAQVLAQATSGGRVIDMYKTVTPSAGYVFSNPTLSFMGMSDKTNDSTIAGVWMSTEPMTKGDLGPVGGEANLDVGYGSYTFDSTGVTGFDSIESLYLKVRIRWYHQNKIQVGITKIGVTGDSVVIPEPITCSFLVCGIPVLLLRRRRK